MLLFIGGSEIIVILLFVVMFFGADKIPEIARGLGKVMSQVKNASNDIKREINNSAQKTGVDINGVTDIKKSVEDVKEVIDEVSGSVKRKM